MHSSNDSDYLKRSYNLFPLPDSRKAPCSYLLVIRYLSRCWPMHTHEPPKASFFIIMSSLFITPSNFFIFARAARSLLLSEAHGLLNRNRELALECF